MFELKPETKLSTDEQMVPFKGQLNVKQYVKEKPSPCGMLYDFLIYQGSTTELNPTYAAVFRLQW